MASPSAEGSEGDNPGRSFDISNLPASAGKSGWPTGPCTPWGKLWDDKLSTASKVWEDQLKSATGKAEAALDAGISAASEAVRAGVSAAGRESEAVKSRLQRFYDTGLAHYQATEQQALELMKQGVRFVRKEHPEASMATGVAAFFVLLPGPRRFLLRHTIGRFRSEEAMFKSAEQRYAGLKEKAEGHNGELQKLQASTAVTQERLQLAELEYQRGRAKLKSTAGELESLASRVRGSSKAAKRLITDLRELPSKQALQLRSDAANTANTVGNQAKVLDKALRRVAKQYGL
ncbi:hypothetical protein CHLNCDRAFT_134807 [Chlorella variabilis]|uniref:Uncharacterized protein n=1 Tax=Chlorella variabilis TaxID=554065 RepID=E1ZGU0_CHLVA|nr:hypothetical protein CHLNCDRAFT_134807 [Chlorella variabilis]EFN54813.1 hypothetical protein CHLNCDRAFT_134807 [Chlorella variabilis]|eukprot:XP_005846915.1 hypothetical protein CHLNCDRAFT_134807 [Chlorella variabilis]